MQAYPFARPLSFTKIDKNDNKRIIAMMITIMLTICVLIDWLVSDSIQRLYISYVTHSDRCVEFWKKALMTFN